MFVTLDPKRRFLLFVIVAAGVSVLVGNAQQPNPGRPAAPEMVNGHEAVAGEVLVKFRRPVTAAERARTAAQLDLDHDVALNSAGVRHLRSRGLRTSALLAHFQGAANVEYAEPNYIVHAIQAPPNDPQFGQLWGLQNLGQVVNGSAGLSGADIDAVPAWGVSTGSAANVVGVLDTGIDYTHPDLAGNVWSAPTNFTVTIGGVPRDCLAGTHGFNALNNTCIPMDDNNHGSHVAGTIGAVGHNSIGISGVSQTASVMGLKFLNASGSGSTTGAINLIEFAIQAKGIFGASANVRILSNSWGGGGFSQALLDQINTANTHGMLFVAAAGNSNSNNDLSPHYPASYAAASIISVAATTSTDGRASFSNYGATTVDLGAPGVNILSTIRGGTYVYFNGTSMATPHVSGAAALMLAACPTLNTADLKSTIMITADPVASLAAITVTGGRLTLNRAVATCAGAPPPPPPPPPVAPAAPMNLQASNGPGAKKISLVWSASAGATSYRVKRSATSGGPYPPSSVIASPTGTSYTNTGLKSKQTYYYVVSAVNAGGESLLNSNEASATVP